MITAWLGVIGCHGPRVAPAIAPAAPAPGPAPAPPTRLAVPAAAWFGQWNEDADAFDRKTRFDRREGEPFGWRIRIRCTGPVKFREVMRLPAPGDWTFTPEGMPGTTISADQTTTTTIDYAACRAGWVEHAWRLAAGDPAGTYVITVELEGHAPHTFRPRFVEPPAD